jgi:hypothetical protein
MRSAILAVAVLLAAVPAGANDDRPEIQRMRFVEHEGGLTVIANFAKLFDSTAYTALSSGFPSTVLISTVVYRRDSSTPVAINLIERSIVYDLWDEQYLIRYEAPRRPIKVKRQSDAFKLLTSLESVPIASLEAIPHDEVFYLRMTVQLNPVSDETLAEVRRWLSQGTGGGLDRGGSVFGSFVSVFVNPRIAKAERILQLRSQPFFRPRATP